MQVKVEALSSVKKRFDFEIPADRVATEIDKVYDKIQKRASLPGFRRGKVPKSLIEKNYQGQMEGDVVKNLFNESYFEYLQEQSIFPVGYPEVETENLVRGEPLKFSATVEIFPEVVVKHYEKLEVKKERFVLDGEVVEKRLQQMRESMAQLKPLEVERPAETGDTVIIDFTGYLNGEPFENGAGSDYSLELGSGSFIPGFEEQIVGLKVGEEKRIQLTFPESYHSKELAGQEAEFAVTVKEIKVKELPALDDEFAQEFGEFKTLDELRAKVTDMYEKQEMERIENEFRERLVKELVERNDFEVPDTLVERHLGSMLENAKRRLMYQNLTLEMMGMDEEQYKQQFRGIAANQVKGSLLLDSLAKLENITVSEQEIDEKVRAIAAEGNQDIERINSYYQQNRNARESLLEQLKEDKVLALIAGRAVVTEVDRQSL